MERVWAYEDFYGLVDLDYLCQTTRELLTLAAQIRGTLGKKGYLLDNYLCTILAALSEINAQAAMERARERTWEFNALITAAMNGGMSDNPLFARAREYIEHHPLDYQEQSTRRNIYAAALLDDFTTTGAAKYREELQRNLAGLFDGVELRHLRKDISRLAGDLPVERLDLFLRQRFLLVTPLAAFTQALTDELLFALTHRDAETGKMVALEGPIKQLQVTMSVVK